MEIDIMSLFTPVNGKFPSLAETLARADTMMAQIDDELIPGRDDLDEAWPVVARPLNPVSQTNEE